MDTQPRSEIGTRAPSSPEHGTTRVWDRIIGGAHFAFTAVTMPNGELRYFVKRYNGYGDDGTEWGVTSGKRFSCAWTLVHSIIVKPAAPAPVAVVLPAATTDSAARILKAAALDGIQVRPLVNGFELVNPLTREFVILLTVVVFTVGGRRRTLISRGSNRIRLVRALELIAGTRARRERMIDDALAYVAAQPVYDRIIAEVSDALLAAGAAQIEDWHARHQYARFGSSDDMIERDHAEALVANIRRDYGDELAELVRRHFVVELDN